MNWRCLLSSGLPNKRVPKTKVKRGISISRQKFYSNLLQRFCLGPEKLIFHYVYATHVKDSQCLNRGLLDFTARKLRSVVFKIL